ncbi:hypothetical protein CMV_024557 [Castanea mollissima]|uniref:Uncharacterized protein n=1 Tax=Castanea mollissima TaxID=60419 RepID=A0A8J4QFB8_9ROSI|nr:hypothetical protein CMV_024557 [Castanea mollissima]
MPPEPETDLNELKSSTCIQLRSLKIATMLLYGTIVVMMADFCIRILKVKAPLLAHNRFVEAIFILNDCRAHIGDANSHGSQVESQLFTIRANYENSRSERMHIYVSLLRQMAQEQSLMSLWS